MQKKATEIMVQLTHCIFTCSAKRFHCSHVPSTASINNDKKLLSDKQASKNNRT